MSARRGLDLEAVIRAAERLVDRDGASNLTMTALAAQLEVRPPSLYSHVDNLEALRGWVQVRAMADLGNDLQRAAMGRTRRDGVRALADAQRSFATRHPGRYELALSAPVDREALREASLAAGDALQAVMRSFGLTSPPYELFLVCLATLHGVLMLHRAGLFRDALDLDAAYAEATESVAQLISRAARQQNAITNKMD